MLETIREFGLEELANAGSAADLLQRHAEYFVRMAADAELGLRGPQQHQWLDRLEREHDNLRAALAWTEANPEHSGIAWRLAGGLWRFWFLRDYIEEGRKTLDRLIRSDAPGSPAARAKAIAGAAFLAYFQGEAADAGRFFQESMRLSDEVGDMWCLAFSLCGIGSTSQARGDHHRAKIALQRGLNLARKVQDPWLIGLALTSHWSTIVHFGEFKDAEPMFRECLEHCRAAGDPSLTCWPLMILGVIDLMTGKAETAGPYFTEALECARRVGNKQSMSSSLESLAHTWILTGRIEDGARLLGAGEAARDASGTPRQPYGVPLYEGLLAHLRSELGSERAGELLQAGRAIPVDEAIKIALGESDFGE
jgi:non-specific serine/threonine protein kinase